MRTTARRLSWARPQRSVWVSGPPADRCAGRRRLHRQIDRSSDDARCARAHEVLQVAGPGRTCCGSCVARAAPASLQPACWRGQRAALDERGECIDDRVWPRPTPSRIRQQGWVVAFQQAGITAGLRRTTGWRCSTGLRFGGRRPTSRLREPQAGAGTGVVGSAT